MSAKLVQLSVLSLLLLAMVAAQTKTKVSQCYQCNSAADKETLCEDNDEPGWKLDDKWKKPCARHASSGTSAVTTFGDAVGCRIITQTVKGKLRTIRECAYSCEMEEGKCKDVNGVKRTGNNGIKIYYTQCSSDNCNGSTTAVVSVGALLIACVVALLRQ